MGNGRMFPAPFGEPILAAAPTACGGSLVFFSIVAA
jgi:hypothetical protein